MSETFLDNLDKKANSFLSNAFLAIVASLVRPIATLTEIFFRKQMGERYFTAWNILGGLVVYGSFVIRNLVLMLKTNKPPKNF